MTNDELTTIDTAWKTKLLAAGALIGALTGIGAAYLLIQRADEEGIQFSSKEGVKLGMTLLGFFRQITQIGD
ncbi:MAG: hypothetical protein ABFS03_05140 [Chloroflexota bacterium]